MTEKDFWVFLNSKLARGKVDQMSAVMYSDDPQVNAAGKYIGAHSFLPKEYDRILEGEISGMGELLLGATASISTKEAIMVLLAHVSSKKALSILRAYNELPDKELRLFAQMALDECEMWNE